MKTSCYCEVEFLKQFGANIPVPNPFEDNNDYSVWCSYRNLFFKNSCLMVDDLEKLKNEAKAVFSMNKDVNKNFIFLLAKQLGDGVIEKIEEKPIDNIDFETINPHTVFFLSNTAKCKELEENYGMLFISNKTKNTNAKILFGFEPSEISITNDLKNYQFISSYRHPCNSIIINDAYLLAELDDTLDENLIALLKSIMPNSLKKMKFQILILSGDNKNAINLRNKYSTIESKIRRLNKPYPIELKIIFKKAKHNRNIITNYLKINAGHAFTLFERGRLRYNLDSDTFTFSSIGKDGVKKVFDDLKKEYQKIETNTSNNSTKIFVMPENQTITNRLLTI